MYALALKSHHSRGTAVPFYILSLDNTSAHRVVWQPTSWRNLRAKLHCSVEYTTTPARAPRTSVGSRAGSTTAVSNSGPPTAEGGVTERRAARLLAGRRSDATAGRVSRACETGLVMTRLALVSDCCRWQRCVLHSDGSSALMPQREFCCCASCQTRRRLTCPPEPHRPDVAPSGMFSVRHLREPQARRRWLSASW